MDPRIEELEKAVPLPALLGYVNFSEGRPDPRFQKQINDAYQFLAGRGVGEPWVELGKVMKARLTSLKGTATGAFRDTTQAEAVLALVFDHLLPGYRQHHADLLFHLTDRSLFQPFFIARALEVVLEQGGPWDQTERIVRAALGQLNDFVGYRPLAILETRPRGEPYEHERVRPIPLYLRGAGVAAGRYHDLVSAALDILRGTDPGLLADASFDLELLDELALDPRAYDHNHPVNRRSNYIFGEWDPHHLDNQGRYRRFVVRRVTLEGLLSRLAGPADPARQPKEEVLFEAAAVLAGTMLMAAGISGSGPTTHDSTVSLHTLMPKIARYRDAFYAHLLETRPGPHGERLRQELSSTRQHFGGARQHLNQFLARQRAAQLQQRHLALLFAEMGYAEASRRQASEIPAASIRVLSEIQSRLTTGLLLVRRGALAEAAQLLPEVEQLLHRGIAAGALVDPWNILGFQGIFPLSPAQEDGIRDPRVDELIQVMGALFNLYDRLLSEAASAGNKEIVKALTPDLRRLAAWWDRFATTEVSEVRPIHGATTAASAEQVAAALARWHDRGEASADLLFWRQQQGNFRSPKAFALVVDTLLRKHDYQAAMALLVTWVAQVEQVPLEEGMYSFHDLALRWVLGVVRGREDGVAGTADPAALIKRFFELLEANAEEYWPVPELDLGDEAEEGDKEEKEESIYGAAYEDVTYHDSADDEQEGAVFDGAPATDDFSLDDEAERLAGRLRFLSTVARLWHVAVQGNLGAARAGTRIADSDLAGWLAQARGNYQRLLLLVDAIHGVAVPEPTGTYDSLVEYDRRRSVKEQLLYQTIHTCHDTFLSMSTLQSLSEADDVTAPSPPPWGPFASQLERAMMRGDAVEARRVLPGFLGLFRGEPLVFTALSDGGHPRQVLRARVAQTILRALAMNLPRLGLLRETLGLLRMARSMEQERPAPKAVSQFNELFQTAFQSVIEAVVEAAPDWGPPTRWSPSTTSDAAPNADRALAGLLEKIAAPFLKLWIEHSQTLRLFHLEMIPSSEAWKELRGFVRKYGSDLFHARFMTLANLRGILHRGTAAYLDYLRENQDPLKPMRLLVDLGTAISREKAAEHLETVLHALVENYEEYRDYNSTTAQSDYGENLHTLLDFLKIKAGYERQAWNLKPLAMVHDVLVRKSRFAAAAMWREAFAHYNRAAAEQHLNALARVENDHAMRLHTVAERLEERFVRQLDLDRLCALVRPAMDEAGRDEHPSFGRLEGELKPYRDSPSGVGLDVPHWLRRIEQEVHRVWATRSALAALAEDFARVPRRHLPFPELDEQLRDWGQA